MSLLNIIADIDLCSSSAGYRIFGFVGYLLEFIKIGVPIIIILIGILDFLKALWDQKDDQMKKAQTTFIKRLIIGAAVFFVFPVVSLLVSMVGNQSLKEENNVCIKSLLNPNWAMSMANGSDKSISDEFNAALNSPTVCNALGKPFMWKDNECVIDTSNVNVE